MKKIAYILTVLLAAACVYPYTPDIQEDESGDLVVEGDIIVGKECQFDFSFVRSFGNRDIKLPDIDEVWIEDGKGNEYRGEKQSVSSYYYGQTILSYSVDLTDAPHDGQYSLKFKRGNGDLYYSKPSPVENACEIVGMSHTFDESQMYFYISLSGIQGNNYRISWNEDWEYKTQFLATVKYLPPSHDLPAEYQATGMMEPLPSNQVSQNCWGKSLSSSILTISTTDLDSGELPDYHFLTLPVNTLKLSYIYSVEAVVTGISDEALDYLENVKELSLPKADLFTPIPSMVRGNIRNSRDEDELIIGYVGVGMETRMRHFVYASDEHRYYRYPNVNIEMSTNPYDWYSLYITGYLPIGGDEQMGYSWVPKRCIDCATDGGSKNKPEFWPNDDI